MGRADFSATSRAMPLSRKGEILPEASIVVYKTLSGWMKLRYLAKALCRMISNIRIAPALAALSDSLPPGMGI